MHQRIESIRYYSGTIIVPDRKFDLLMTNQKGFNWGVMSTNPYTVRFHLAKGKKNIGIRWLTH